MRRRMLNAHSGLAVPREMKYFGESISQHLLERWRDPGLKRAMSAQEVALVEAVCREPMKRLGYEPVSDRLRIKARVALALKSLYWMWKRYRNMWKRNFAMKYAPLARFHSL